MTERRQNARLISFVLHSPGMTYLYYVSLITRLTPVFCFYSLITLTLSVDKYITLLASQ